MGSSADEPPPPPRRCASCGTVERAAWWLRLFTRLTLCELCGRELCPNCFTVDPCEDGGPHVDDQGAV